MIPVSWARAIDPVTAARAEWRRNIAPKFGYRMPMGPEEPMEPDEPPPPAESVKGSEVGGRITEVEVRDRDVPTTPVAIRVVPPAPPVPPAPTRLRSADPPAKVTAKTSTKMTPEGRTRRGGRGK